MSQAGKPGLRGIALCHFRGILGKGAVLLEMAFAGNFASSAMVFANNPD